MKDLESISFEDIIAMEQKRQNENAELIASENFPSERVLQAAGSILTNKYAEGYPGKRYYGGCEYIDMIEQKAINNVCKLFDVKYANVQPHCGSSANQAVYRALLEKGDTVMGMDLGAGGHLTHGHKMSFSGQDYNIISYGVDENGKLDLVDFEKKLFKHQPKMVIVGASSYSQIIPYEQLLGPSVLSGRHQSGRFQPHQPPLIPYIRGIRQARHPHAEDPAENRQNHAGRIHRHRPPHDPQRP